MRWTACGLLCLLVLAGCAGPGAENAGDGDFRGDVEQRIDDDITLANGTGAVSGVVRNVAGVALEGANVLVIGVPGATSTDATGTFLLTKVPPGRHVLRVDRIGYLSLERDIVVADGKVTRLNITLADNAPGGPGFREHLHDLWRGQTEITIFEDTVRHPHRYAPQGTALLPCTRGGGVTVSSANCYDIPLVLEPGTVVPPGTERLTVTADWQKRDFVPAVQLYYQPANESALRATEPVGPGQSAEVMVRHPMSDHGHQRESQWRLFLHAEPKAGGTSFSSQYVNEQFVGDFSVRIVAHKGELPPEAPHPRYWKAGDTLVLLDETHDVVGLPRTRSPTTTTCSATAPCFVLPDDVVVPPGTTRLQVSLEYAAKTPPVQDHISRKTLAFRTAAVPPATATMADLRVEAPGEIARGKTVYELVLADEEADPFYQARSNWLFLLANEGEERGSQFVEDCYHYIVGCGGSRYTLQVVAINDDWTPELAGLE